MFLFKNIRPKLDHIFQEVYPKLIVEEKDDSSPVTQLDIMLSKLIKEEFSRAYPKGEACFFCEEDHTKLSFPSLIVDPIDGTKDLIKGTGEISVSIAYFHSSDLSAKESYAYIYNPQTGFYLSSFEEISQPEREVDNGLWGFVSRTEWEKGCFKSLIGRPDVRLNPKGSIAYKLGLLASGGCDFVLSLSPKNIWDIAGGTLLAETRGIHLFNKKGKVDRLEKSFIEGPLLWCKEEHLSKLSYLLDNNSEERAKS